MAAARSREDVQPTIWEIPVAGAAAWLLLSAALLPASQGLAAVMLGHGWVWPHGSTALLQSLGGLTTGQVGRGLPPRSYVPPAFLIYALIILGQSALLATTALAVVQWWRHLAPGTHKGMASRAEVERVLGVSNLRRRRQVIRPDLFEHPERSNQ